MTPEFILWCIILIIGVSAAGFPREKTYLARLMHLEIPGFGLLLIMLAYDEMLALVTFIGVTGISTFVLGRGIERKEAAE